ncbi:MAG: CHAD domain-containing protein [Actinomycetota bacterium]
MKTATRTSQDEREAKRSVEAGWELPALTGTAGIARVEEAPSQLLEAVYFDTPDLRLIRSGITLRYRQDHREGAGSGAGADGEREHGWTLKLPSGAPGVQRGPTLARQELMWPGDPDSPPPEAVGLIRATLRTASLGPVARLRTDRRRFRLLGSAEAGDELIAEVDDDRVALTEGPPGVRALDFREVEVELAPETPEGALEAIVDCLESAGASGAVPVPEVLRALGPAALEPPHPAAGVVGESSTLGEVVSAFIGEGVTALLRFDPALRLGGDAENLHQARVASRRLRSHLRTFRRVLDPGWLGEAEPDLRWIGRMLGAVRDADVLHAALAREVDTLGPADAAIAHDLLDRLTAEREEANRALLGALDSDAYLALLDRLVGAVATPPLRPGVPGSAAAAKMLPALVRRPWKRLRRQVAQLGDAPSDEALHETRKRAKHLRYAAELATPVAGGQAGRLAKKAKQLQEVLGAQHDAVVLSAYLRSAAGATGSYEAMIAGELLTRADAEAARHRPEWPGAWKKVAMKKRRAWLKGAALPQ